jgi:hypothetical protein
MPRLRTPLGVAIALALAIILVVLAAASVDAQVVRGAVTETTSERPVPGAIVRLISADSLQVAMLLTDRDGRFVAVAPRQGLYVLQAEHIRYATTRTTAFAVPTAGAITVNVAIPIREDATSRGARASEQIARPTARTWEGNAGDRRRSR